MNIYYDQDADLSLIKSKTVAIIGYGSQGHAHAANLKDSGVHIIVGARKNGPSWQKAIHEGYDVRDIASATKAADVVMILLPDEHQPSVYATEIAPHLKSGAAIAFAHGFNIHYNQIIPSKDLDVIMIAPKGAGYAVRREYLKGGGIPSLIAVHQDASANAKNLALSYAAANGATKSGVIETTFKEETETDLFGEQAVLCGGLVSLIKTGFETLTEAGYAPQMAYFECLHEIKLIVDLIYEGGIANMNNAISNNAEFGEYVTGPEVINQQSRDAMRHALKRIQSGEYANMFIQECASQYPFMTAQRHKDATHPIEIIGKQLRNMMPWITENKLVNQEKSNK